MHNSYNVHFWSSCLQNVSQSFISGPVFKYAEERAWGLTAINLKEFKLSMTMDRLHCGQNFEKSRNRKIYYHMQH